MAGGSGALSLMAVSLVAAACSGSSSVSLNAKRLGHTSEAIGSYLYVFGGGTYTIERAKIDDDGSLEGFDELSDVRLATRRTGHTSAVIGGFVYVFAGAADGTYSTSVERAPIKPDGSIGSFAVVSGTALNTARIAHAGTTTESSVYVLGGAPDGTSLFDSVERAPINADGSLGAFVTLAAHLQTPRRNFRSIVLGSYLYAFGGTGPAGDLDTIERAPIAADGSLGAFEILTDVKLPAAGLDHALVRINDLLYVTGGLHGALVASNDVASATVAADGTLGYFAPTAGGLVIARGTHTATVAGAFMYVLGGVGATGILTSVERCPVNADGTLGDFENLSQ